MYFHFHHRCAQLVCSYICYFIQDGESPLFYTLRFENFEVFKYLIQIKANTAIKNVCFIFLCMCCFFILLFHYYIITIYIEKKSNCS